MRLKIQCTDVLPILTFGMYTVGEALVGKTAPILNLGRVGGWLEGEAWKRSTGKVGYLQSWAFESRSWFTRDCTATRGRFKSIQN